jgi:hypothetical protein
MSFPYKDRLFLFFSVKEKTHFDAHLIKWVYSKQVSFCLWRKVISSFSVYHVIKMMMKPLLLMIYSLFTWLYTCLKENFLFFIYRVKSDTTVALGRNGLWDNVHDFERKEQLLQYVMWLVQFIYRNFSLIFGICFFKLI